MIEDHKVAINRIRGDEDIQRLLDALELTVLPRFSPKKDGNQEDRWKFESGRVFENTRILNILRGVEHE